MQEFKRGDKVVVTDKTHEMWDNIGIINRFYEHANVYGVKFNNHQDGLDRHYAISADDLRDANSKETSSMIEEVGYLQAYDLDIEDWVDVEILKTTPDGYHAVEIHASSPKGTPRKLFWTDELRRRLSLEDIMVEDMIDGEILSGEHEYCFLKKISEKLVKKGWKKDD